MGRAAVLVLMQTAVEDLNDVPTDPVGADPPGGSKDLAFVRRSLRGSKLTRQLGYTYELWEESR